MRKLAFTMALIIFFCSAFFLLSCNSGNTTSDRNVEETDDSNVENNIPPTEQAYILNKNTKKFHFSDCYVIALMNEENKITFFGNRESVINQGYKPCLKCNP